MSVLMALVMCLYIYTIHTNYNMKHKHNHLIALAPLDQNLKQTLKIYKNGYRSRSR